MLKELIVDRIEGKKAVLITEEEEEIHLPVSWFPTIHEGMAIDMTLTENPEREEAARKEAEELLARIQKNQ